MEAVQAVAVARLGRDGGHSGINEISQMPGIPRMASGDITADHVFCRSAGSAGAVRAAGSLQRAFQHKAVSSAGIRRIAARSLFQRTARLVDD